MSYIDPIILCVNLIICLKFQDKFQEEKYFWKQKMKTVSLEKS